MFWKLPPTLETPGTRHLPQSAVPLPWTGQPSGKGHELTLILAPHLPTGLDAT